MYWKELDIKEKIQLTGACLFLLTLSYNRELNQLFMILFMVGCVPSINRESWQKNKKAIFLFTSIFLVSVLSASWDPDYGLAWKKLETQLTLLLVPVLFGASYRPTEKKNGVVKAAFIVGVTTALAYLLVVFIYQMRKIGAGSWLQEEYLNHHYSAPIGIHAGFFSCYVALCFFLLIERMQQTRRRASKLGLLVLILLCVTSLFLLTSRSVMLLTLICLLCLIPFNVRRIRWQFVLPVAIAITGLLYFFVTRSQYFENRFTGELNRDVKFTQLTKAMESHSAPVQDSILKNDGTRIERWVAAVRLIKRRPFTGYGTGEEKPVLFKEYEQMGLTVTLDQRYDSHNQFLSFAIKSGLPGMLVFAALLVFAFATAIKERSYIYLCFLIITTGTCLIDTFLEVNKGIFFFAFFNIFFYMVARAGRPVRPAD